MATRRERTYCAECRDRATHVVTRTFGTGDYGINISYGLCDEHLAELVRETDLRFVVTPLSTGRRRQRASGEQQRWAFD